MLNEGRRGVTGGLFCWTVGTTKVQWKIRGRVGYLARDSHRYFGKSLRHRHASGILSVCNQGDFLKGRRLFSGSLLLSLTQPAIAYHPMDRILLVDDNPTNLQVLYQALETEGYELLIAQSGEEALTIAQEARPQLILLDINMPGMNGFEACRRLKDDARTQEAVVIFLSARDDVQDKVKGLELGAVDYISKPFQFEEVVARVQTHLKAYRRFQVLKARKQALLQKHRKKIEEAKTWASRREADYERKTRELENARRLQLAMLPRALPEHPAVEMTAFMKTATEVGGDYYDADVDQEGTLTLVIGDATGHGIQAGMMVTATKSLFMLLARDPDLVEVLKKATVALKRMGLPRLYMALALAKLQGHTLVLAGAGMPPALVYRAETRHVEAIPLKGMPLGSFVDFPYRQTRVELAPGDTVVLMSDGFPELFNAEAEMYGYDRTLDFIRTVGHLPPEAIIAHLMEEQALWLKGLPQTDDVTFLVLKAKPTPATTSDA